MDDSGICIAGRWIGPTHPPFIIAEMSGNHNRSLETALAIVDAAAAAGADAVKLQTYTADTMTLDLDGEGFTISDSESLWRGETLYQLYQKAALPWEWHGPILERCRRHGLIGFSTPFDDSAVSFLESLDVPLFKIASFENTDLMLIRRVAAAGKPILISTGMASLAELAETVACARGAGCRDLILLKCTSTYPASPEDSNLLTIPHLRDTFKLPVGLSDHTLGWGVALASIPLGATVIEKHLTLRRSDGGVDVAFSLEPDEFRTLVIECKRAWQALGEIRYGGPGREEKSRQFRRSLYVVKDMQAGQRFTPDNLRAIRPGYGLPPKSYDLLLGKAVNRDLKRGTPVSWDLVG